TESGGVAITDCIPVGSYTIIEQVPSGWECTNGITKSVYVSQSQLSEVRFGNRQIPPTTTTTTTTTTITTTTTLPLQCGYLKIFKFNDANANGVWDYGEVGLPGFNFNVVGQGRNFWKTTESGGVAITDCIPVGSYTIIEQVPSGWECTNGITKSAYVEQDQLSEVLFGNKQIPSATTTTTTTTTLQEITTTTIPFIPLPKILENLYINANITCVGHGVKIQILRNNEKRVSDAEIDIFLNNKKVAYGRTNTYGIFEFTPEKTGSYFVRARKSGYEEATKYVEIPDCISLCYDNIKNRNETDVDCGGGSCPCCEAEKKCKTNSDCCSNYCYKGTCKVPSCKDGILNQGEEKVSQMMSSNKKDISDCGGPNCPPCPTCYDGIQNQGEQGIDCGGPCEPCCPTCANCADGLKNQGETDIDCGGPCKPCGDDRNCRTNEDCLSNYCYNKTCKTPTCYDGIQNQGEQGIDCGGPCKPCTQPKIGIIASMIKFSTEHIGSILLFLLFLFLILCYIAYNKGKEKGRKEREIEAEMQYLSTKGSPKEQKTK
ncbi:MAG: hypothetical protein QW802_04525, partial [Candidatus Altiarchaeota archaeon]